MAKPKISESQANEALNELMLTGETNSGVSFDEAFAILENADSQKMSELTSEYFTPEKEQTYNLIFEGMSTADLDGKTVDVVLLRNKEGKKMINGNAVLVNSCKRLTQIPSFIRVITGKEVKGAKGTYLDMQVLTLPSATK